MKSPRFDTRARVLQRIFSPDNLERVWREKVRVAMRSQFLNDGIEYFDFHIDRRLECKKLSLLILRGEYIPEHAHRILVEKSKGLCRQLVIPAARDALVLQCLSDALYQEIKQKAPTDRAFFEPKEHRFSTERDQYGTFASWLNFQRALFNFSKIRPFVVVTDIANYYDSISYVHLRNIISSISGVEECVLDMLIYVLSSLLWQPDYMPRVEIGLPQINLDAPRLLAHCFLYELDKFLASDPDRDFVRFMDDIDVGVDTIAAAKRTLRSIDLVLQTRQVRLNSGKTLILSQADALRHFRVVENARLDLLRSRIERKQNSRLNTDAERRLIVLRISRGLALKRFDDGNGDKILKRWIGLAAGVRANLSLRDLLRVFLLRPSVRENVCMYIRRRDLTVAGARMLATAAESEQLVDDAALVDLANHLVESAVITTSRRNENIQRVITACNATQYFGLHCRMWLQSKYGEPFNLLETIKNGAETWIPHERLGRVVGSFVPVFRQTQLWPAYYSMLSESRNHGARDAYRFHVRLETELPAFKSMFEALSRPNPSRGTGITHAKFLCLLSALRNPKASVAQIDTLKTKNEAAWRDIYYRRMARRLGIRLPHRVEVAPPLPDELEDLPSVAE
jgi:hypothetical protein